MNLLLIKYQSGFSGGKRPTFHLGLIQNLNLFFHQSAQFRKTHIHQAHHNFCSVIMTL